MTPFPSASWTTAIPTVDAIKTTSTIDGTSVKAAQVTSAAMTVGIRPNGAPMRSVRSAYSIRARKRTTSVRDKCPDRRQKPDDPDDDRQKSQSAQDPGHPLLRQGARPYGRILLYAAVPPVALLVRQDTFDEVSGPKIRPQRVSDPDL